MLYQQIANYCPQFGLVILMNSHLPQHFVNTYFPHLLIGLIRI